MPAVILKSRVWPEFQMWEQFASDVLIPSLQLDALENSHPVKVSRGQWRKEAPNSGAL